MFNPHSNLLLHKHLENGRDIPCVYAILTVGGDTSSIEAALLAGAALAGGASLLQLRCKVARSTGEFVELALLLQRLCTEHGALFIMNDRVDVALLSGADGVHLGQTDFPVSEARRILGPKRLIGWSTHTQAQVEEAQHLPVDYIAYGPVFGTQTKMDADPAVGLESLAEMCKLSSHPVIGIGGITARNASQVIACGAVGVAVISEIFPLNGTAETALSRTKALKEALQHR